MKSLLLISLALILLLLTAGCLDDLSSTLPPCCDGTCDGVKTSVITVDKYWNPFESYYTTYIVDSNGYKYGASPWWGFDSYNNHNVTFSYVMQDGHRHITGIIEDHDAKRPNHCCCSACCAMNCSCPQERCGV